MSRRPAERTPVGRRLWRGVERLSTPALTLILIAIVLGAIAWAYTLHNTVTGQGAQLTTQGQQLTHIRQAQGRAATKAARAAQQSEQVVQSLPTFAAAIVAGQAQINAYLAHLNCVVTLGPAACGPAPPLPTTSAPSVARAPPTGPQEATTSTTRP